MANFSSVIKIRFSFTLWHRRHLPVGDKNNFKDMVMVKMDEGMGAVTGLILSNTFKGLIV